MPVSETDLKMYLVTTKDSRTKSQCEGPNSRTSGVMIVAVVGLVVALVVCTACSGPNTNQDRDNDNSESKSPTVRLRMVKQI